MEPSVVIVVGITLTLVSFLINFQASLTELDCAVELTAIKQIRSCGSPSAPFHK